MRVPRHFVSMSLALFTAACTSGGSDGNTTVFTNSGSGPAPVSGTLDELKQMVSPQLAIANSRLDIADQLQVREYMHGASIGPEDCAGLEQAVSKNYPLHAREAWSQEKSDHKVQGVKLCPREGSSDKVGYTPQSARVGFSSGSVESTLGIPADKVLTIVHARRMGERSSLREQYLIDSSNKIVEMTSHVALTADGSEYFDVVSTMTKEGDVVGRAYRVIRDTTAKYSWKSASTFVSKDGSISSAMRVRQNDGQGREAIKFSLDVPYQIKWTKHEVSPITRIRGIYQIDGEQGPESIEWLKSKIIFDIVTRGTETCGHGHIGYNAKGGEIRGFGDISCEKNMDVNQTIH